MSPKREHECWLADDESKGSLIEIPDAFDAETAAEQYVEKMAREHEYYDYYNEDNCVEVSVSGGRVEGVETYQVFTAKTITFSAEQIS